MNNIILKIGSGVLIHEQDIMKANEYITKLYGKVCYKFYELGFTNTPASADMIEILGVIGQDYPELWDKLKNKVTGIVCRDPLIFEYLIETGRFYTEEHKEILQALYELAYCEQGFNTLSEIYLWASSNNKGASKKFNLPTINGYKYFINISTRDYSTQVLFNVFFRDMISQSTNLYKSSRETELLKDTFLYDIGLQFVDIDVKYLSLYMLGFLSLGSEYADKKYKKRVIRYYNEQVEVRNKLFEDTKKKKKQSKTDLEQLKKPLDSYFNYIIDKTFNELMKKDTSYSVFTVNYFDLSAIYYVANLKGTELYKKDFNINIKGRYFESSISDIHINSVSKNLNLGYSGEFIKATDIKGNLKAIGFPIYCVDYSYDVKKAKFVYTFEPFYHIKNVLQDGVPLRTHIIK